MLKVIVASALLVAVAGGINAASATTVENKTPSTLNYSISGSQTVGGK